jgi:uncharacterized protein involved in propanediol utilization
LAPARYSWREIESFRPLLGLLRRVIHHGDAALLGCVATASARLNQRILPKPHFERLERLAQETGALGLQVAHSGSVAGLIFSPEDAAGPRWAEAALADLYQSPTWRFYSALTREAFL